MRSVKQAEWHILLLIGILLLASVVRLIGPLRDVALGQTDAYSHLQFLKDWLVDGRLRHPYYPAGYYWVIGLPTRWLGWDPYSVIRFGGAFFGVGLVLSAYYLAKHVWGSKAGLWAAFLIAAFPAFHWLQKTGVGAYPSQLGLMLLPLILLIWDAMLGGQWSRVVLLVPAFSLLAISVPMMALDLLPFLLLDLIVRRVCGGCECPRRSEVIVVSMIALTAALMLLFLLRRGVVDHMASIAAAVASYSYDGDAPVRALAIIFGSYFMPIRWWPGSVLVSLSALVVGAVLVVLLKLMWHKGAAARMISLWAVYAWVQTIFGVAQFPLYWRAGWTLLIALSLLGGWLIPHLLDRMPHRPRNAGFGVLVLLAGMSLLYPPVHQPHLSAAENDLVTVLRALEKWGSGAHQGIQFWFPEANEPDHLAIWARSYTTFDLHQGDPVHAFLADHQSITVRSIRPAAGKVHPFDPAVTHLVILDDRVTSPDSYGLMDLVNPRLTQSFRRAYDGLLEGGNILRERIEAAEEAGRWTIRNTMLDEGLELILLQPRG